METQEKTLWHSLPLSEIKEKFSVDTEKGISQKEVAEKQRSFGLNELPRGKKTHWWEMLFRQFKNPLIFILLIAVGFTFWIGLQEAKNGHGSALEHYADTIVIALAVLINVIIGFWQEFRSNNLFEKLEKLVSIKARVRRDGKLHEVDSKELVPGDIILLGIGMKVPADARIIRSKDLEANEALLTGESMPVKKEAGKELEKDTALAERKNMVHTGTVIEKGEGEALIVATGKNTELGQIAELTASVEEGQTPLQKRLGGLGKKISWAVAFFAVLIVVIGLFEQSVNINEWAREDIVEMFTLAVAVAVAAIPEGLPAAMSIVLAVASQRILNKKGLVKTLLGAEILGSTTVICSDKTGTLTEGKMKVKELRHTEKDYDAALALAMANEAVMIEGEANGEATDRAKLQYYMEHGGNLEETLERLPRLAMLPFDANSKYIASFHKTPEGKIKVFVSGAPEQLLKISTKKDSEKKELTVGIEELAGQGYRLIGAAEKTLDKEPDLENTEALRSEIKDLVYTGTAAIGDPVRSDVPESIQKAREAGIRVIMITGDHKLTARSIGRQLGFRNGDEAVLEGKELDKMSAEELAKKIGDVDIISRASPKHKMQIIEALRLNDEVVAMTGDGVNDAPALKDADVGIALGAGTDVTKEASDLVLMNDSFTTIGEAIKQGRIAFDNIRKVTIFVISNAFTEIMLILVALIGRMEFLPITAVQILWANLVEGGLPSAALAFEPGEDDIMERKPFKRKEPILNKLGMYIIGVVGILSNLILVGLFIWLVHAGYPREYVQTIIFAAVATDTLIYVFSIKRLHQSIFHASVFNNKYLLAGIIVGLGLMFASVYVPALNTLLSTVPLGLFGISLALGSGVMRLLFIELVKWWMRKGGMFHHVTKHTAQSPASALK